jgi:molybdate transport system substrate-binding protein
VLTRQSLDTLAKDGKAVAEATFASSGMGMVVKKGAAKPDIATAESFKRTLLDARTIASSNPAFGGASGVYLSKLLERIGIAEAMKAKTKHPPAGGNAAVLVANGEAELAIQQEPEVISVAGVDFVGPLRAELNNITAYAAGPGVGTKQEDAAEALVRFLHSPEAAAVFRHAASNPVPRRRRRTRHNSDRCVRRSRTTAAQPQSDPDFDGRAEDQNAGRHEHDWKRDVARKLFAREEGLIQKCDSDRIERGGGREQDADPGDEFHRSPVRGLMNSSPRRH